MPDLLLELFSEEIPARMQARAAADLKKLVTDGLVEAGLTYASAGAFSTPRRLVLVIEDMLAESPTQVEERKGPRVDAPEKALDGFLRATGLTREQLEERDDKKGKVFFAKITKPGRPAADIVAETVTAAIRNFPWPKAMRWGTGDLRWVRPLHSILCITHDDAGTQVVPFDIDGIASGDTTRGHRFMAPGEIKITSFDDYSAKLKTAFVEIDAGARAEHIWADATNMAFAQGFEVVEDKALLSEVAGLVEWPIVLMGEIGADFLDLPAEVLQTSMKEHQKFFSVRNATTGRIEKFITVANRETADNGATILAGNQKVLAARLADAKFFWENDLRVAKAGMQPWLDSLSNVTFHNKMGSQADRIGRIATLARELAPAVGANALAATKAAEVAKADLASEMVYEFPELQGTMGRYYAHAAGLSDEIAAACEEHYQPLGPSDDVPSAPVSVAVALAEKLDILAGFWAFDEKPTGSKDPFALRRAALGVIRLILTNNLRLPLCPVLSRQILRHEIADNLDSAAERELFLMEKTVDEIGHGGVFASAFRAVVDALGNDGDDPYEVTEGTWLSRVEASVPAIGSDLLRFFHDRLKVHLKGVGIRHDVIDACIAMDGNDDLHLVVARAHALSAFLATEDGENLVQGWKRAANILSQAEEQDGVSYEYGADVKFAEADEERALFAALDAAETRIAPAIADEDFAAAMGAIAGLRGPIDAFFEAVQVNAENDIVRRNRLNLLSRIRATCAAVADLSRLEG
ncbi:MAG: glycine--tRNA ligase subunit beta [Brevirhabdus sp.]